jgi:hypothetical protein
MSFHEISDERDPKRADSDRGTEADSRVGRDGDPASQDAPTGGWSREKPPGDADGADPGDGASAIPVSGRESAVAPSAHVETAPPSDPESSCIGMQSQMGRSQEDQQTPQCSGPLSDIHILRTQTGGKDIEHHHSVSAQASAYLASWR